MKNLRSEFEKLPEIKEMLSGNNDLKWCCDSGRYINHRVFQDVETGYINGAIYAFKEQQKKIDEKQKYIDHLHSLMDEAVLHMQGGSYAEALELLK